MTAKTYKLPDVLGGGEYDGQPVPERGVVMVAVPGYGQAPLPATWLTEVKVLPEEPPVGSVVLIDRRVFHRRDTAGIDWWDYHDGTWLTWKLICDLGVPVLLVPDPFAEPVELPTWIGPVEVARTMPDGTFVYLGFDEPDRYFVHLTDEQAREMARALWAAADRAEASDAA